MHIKDDYAHGLISEKHLLKIIVNTCMFIEREIER